jgi:hypothetical protein
MTKYVDASPSDLLEGRLLPSDLAILALTRQKGSGWKSIPCASDFGLKTKEPREGPKETLNSGRSDGQLLLFTHRHSGTIKGELGYRVCRHGACKQQKSYAEFKMKVQTGIKAGQYGLEGVRITNKKPTGKGGV